MASNIRIESLFGGLSFTKTAEEIRRAAALKLGQVTCKIDERKKRISQLRKEYNINDADLIQLLTEARRDLEARTSRMSYSISNSGGGTAGGTDEKIIGAGVVSNILTESDQIEAEKDQVKHLGLIVRNLKPIPRFCDGTGAALPEEEFHVSKADLEYLGL